LLLLLLLLLLVLVPVLQYRLVIEELHFLDRLRLVLVQDFSLKSY